MTNEERRLRAWMFISMILYTGCGLYFLFFHNILLKQINYISKMLFSLPPTPLPFERFWLSLTIGLMASIATCSYLAYKDIKKNIACVIPIMASKLASTLIALFFFITKSYLAHLVIFVVDFPMFLITLILYIKIKQ